ncbi:ribonuclease III [Nitrosomonas sp. Is37]|uniref:ribonuclease III n=1 Tax=Nitrosomonas sp. Is37 TaxID=3080535 RepID=UPI00294B61BE|nr:ribonuclease III [Nitrosomonas sp. Is37]MDV6343729.1 ribonuclease III [Nitrosomonas sp. Is37]
MNPHSLNTPRLQNFPLKNQSNFFLKIGYVFKQPELLQEALTHRSFGYPHNERLEFLGDSALNCAVSALLFKQFPLLPEGNLSRLRANLVNQHALFELASVLRLGDLIRLGEGERKSGGHYRPSILANTLEALIGAIYLEGGFLEVENFVNNLYKPLLQNLDLETLGKDPKTMLQEYLQSRKAALPEYTVIATSGEAHRQKFKVECVIPKLNIRTIGEGTSRRRAEQDAAKQAYELIIHS